MLRSKSDIDKHALGLLYKARSEHERNLRCFHIAKLYHKVHDFESTKRYVNMYLSVRDDSAAAHKLLGQALEGLGQKMEAIAAYTKSLKLESDQSDLIVKVCELLCDKNVEFDPVLARYWYERASLLFPHSLPVLMLKEKLITVDNPTSSKDLEELLHAELKAKPTDINVRIKLLKMYADSGRTEMALNHAFEVEARQTNQNSFAWYQCINNICQAHNRDNIAKCNWEFYISWLAVLDRLCLLSCSENLSQNCDISEAVNSVYSMDQALFNAHQSVKKSEVFTLFLKQMSAQLSYMIGFLLMKKAKKGNVNWKEVKRLVAPLFLTAANVTIKIEQSLMSKLKFSQQKSIQSCSHHFQSRNIQAGHFLHYLIKENRTEKMFLDKVSHFLASDWKRQIFEKVFSTVEDKKPSMSHFLTSSDYSVPLKVPSINSLKPTSYMINIENTYFGSLHHLVWLGLRSLEKTSSLSLLNAQLNVEYKTGSFGSLQFTINNLNNVGVETLNQLDVDSFLYATVFCTAAVLEEGKSNGNSFDDKPQELPADISSPLCTAEQGKWWSNLCALVKGDSHNQSNLNESMSDLRFSLQRGIEVVRGEGMSPFLIAALARTFSARSGITEDSELSEGLSSRAAHLWRIAYPMLERLASNKSLITTPKMNSLFDMPMKNVGIHEAKELFEEAKIYFGFCYLKKYQFEKAVDELKGIKSTTGNYNLGCAYQRWAEHILEGSELVTPDIRSKCSVLASKAKEHFSTAKSMAKQENKEMTINMINENMDELEDLLSQLETTNGVSERDCNGGSEDSSTCVDGSSPVQGNVMFSNHRNSRHHTSTPFRSQEQRTNRFNMSELIDLLSVQQSTSQLKMQQVLEQIKLVVDKLDSVASEQRSQRNVVENLASRLNSFEAEMRTNVSDIKKDLKKPDLAHMFDEEEYADEMLQYPSYSQYYNQPQRVVAASATPATVPTYANQYFSPRLDPRIDSLYQGYFNQQSALPFADGQVLPDFLRQPKVNQPLLHPLQPTLPPTLNLTPNMPGPSRVPATPSLPLSSFAGSSASDVLPTQPSLTVTIPPSMKLSMAPFPTTTTTTTGNAAHNFQIPLPPQSLPKPTITIEEREPEDETPPPTYDPMPDYKPIVPLPDEVEVHTGEEDEEVLFEKRAKLFRFVDKAWKDRGVGNLKILKHKTSGKVRIVMRRDQVHKICANHVLTADMELLPKNNTPNAWVWFANDFADEEVKLEQFCAKFKTEEESEEFKKVFDKFKVEVGRETAQKPDSAPKTPESKGPSEPKVPQDKIKTPTTSFQVQPTGFSFGGLFSSAPVLPKPSEPASQPQMSQLGGFTFSLAQPKLRPPEPLKEQSADVSKEPSPFTKFNFGLPSESQSKNTFSFISKLGESKVDVPNPFAVTSTTSPPRNNTGESAKGTTAGVSSSSAKEEGEADNFVPTATFEPVVPMPDLVPVQTGEENEEIIFEDRAQLYRYCKETKQWKERGIGPMRILKHKETGCYRLLMRREQVLKVCCNHRITCDIKLKFASSSDRALSWAAKDHAEEPPSDELFSLKFKTSDQAKLFKEAFEKVQKAIKEEENKAGTSSLVPSTKVSSEVGKKSLAELLKRPQGSWDCEDCYSPNKGESLACLACGKAKPGAAPKSSEVPKPTTTFSFGIPQGYTQEKSKDAVKPATSFTFGLPQPIKPDVKPIEAKPLSKDSSNSSLPLSELLKPPQGSWNCEDCYSQNKSENETCLACGKAKPGTVPKSSEKPTTTFTFGIPQKASENNANPPSLLFGTQSNALSFTPSTTASATLNFGTNKESSDTGNKTFVFGSGGFNFSAPKPPEQSSPVVTSSSKPGFVFASPTSSVSDSLKTSSFGSATFQFSLSNTNVTSPGNTSNHDESYDPEEEEEEDHIQFQPIVPLPDKVDVVTGEENETILYQQRAKLFRYDSSSKEWKERGVGDIKILQHNETGKLRFLMRREPVMKVCLNHFITSAINLKVKDEKTWMWYAVDFAEGEPRNEQLALRFKTPDLAQAFKDDFDKAMLVADKPPEQGEASEGSAEESEGSEEDSGSGSGSTSDSDVMFVSEQKASPELVAVALSLQLPANYFCYLDKPDCPGCIGCKEDSEEDQERKVTSNKNEHTKTSEVVPESPQNKLSDGQSSEAPKSIFGGSGQGSKTSFFGTSQITLKGPSFSFAQAFMPSTASKEGEKPASTDSKPSEDLNSSGFLFQNQNTFSSSPLQKNIFSSASSGNMFFGGGNDALSFGSLAKSVPSDKTGMEKGDPPTFGSLAKDTSGITTQQQPGFLFQANSLPSFSTLSGAGEEAPFVTGHSSQNFKWEGAGAQIFGASLGSKSKLAPAKDDDDSDGEGEAEGNTSKDDNPDPYFEPQIPLPAEIEVRTGEEDEEILFCERSKLYRYTSETKEWKERGVGEMKVLKHKEKNVYRFLMRREQVYKVVCNQLITKSTELKSKTPKSFMWTAMNYSDDSAEPKLEFLAASFKNEDIASRFKSVVDSCLEKLNEASKAND